MEYLNLNLDKNLTLNSNTTISSQKALKSYIDAKRINLDFLQANAPSEFSIGDKWLNTTDKKLYTATSSSVWDSGVALTDGQIYSFENLLYHYDGTNILIYSTETITEQNNRNEIKNWFGTQNEYDSLSNYDDNTNYYIVDNASVISTLLATQQEFNNSVQNKAATPYQVNQKLGNYLPLAGGNLDAGAVLRLTNSNNGTVTLAYNTNNYLTVSSNLSVNGTISTNNLIATSGNIYNGSISGTKAIWSNSFATSSAAGIVKPDGTTTSVDANGIISVIGGSGGTNLPLFMSFWSDHLLNDVRWLRADTFSWQSGTVYTAGYNHLVDDIDGKTAQTETIGSYTITYYQANDGHKIVLADQETNVSNIYNATGVAWYYILDTTNTRFKLPRENPAREELIQTLRVKGNGMTLGLTNGTTEYGLTSNSSVCAHLSSGAYGQNIGNTANVTSAPKESLGITTDPTKSGIISDMADSTSVYKGHKYLYFYVGNYTQSAIEQTAGLNSELFNGKADVNLLNVSNTSGFRRLIEISSPNILPGWYKVYEEYDPSTGTFLGKWCEQGGYSSGTVTFLKEMTDTNYTITFGDYRNGSATSGEFRYVTAFSTTGFTKSVDTNGSFWWKAEGYID